LEVHRSRASAVVVQRVPADAADWFMDWQRGVTAAAEGFAGYRATDIYPPADAQDDHWVIALHFDDEKSLQQWLSSPVRAQWIEKLRVQASQFEVKRLPGGFGAWFTGLQSAPHAPPGWKMVVSVVLALFPTVVIINLIAGSYLSKLGFALSMLIGNFLSVSILQWGLMPMLTRLLGPWLNADRARRRALSWGGLVAILLILFVMAGLFRLTGMTPS
jgi:uncharacterized protein